MIELERHIEILLLDCDCVIVPGFGGFVAHHRDARFDEADNMFLPPLRTLGFNPKLNMNDSLLVQSYVEAYDISYPEALARVETEVDELKHNIEKDGYYEFENLGHISLNSQGGYVFEPCESGILTPELYGLTGVELQTASSLNLVESKVLAAAKNETVAETPGISTEIGTSVAALTDTQKRVSASRDEVEEETERTIKIKVSVLRNAVAVACAVIAFFVIATPIKTDVQNTGKSLSSFEGGALYSLLQEGETASHTSKPAMAHPMEKAATVKSIAVPVQKKAAEKEDEKKENDASSAVVDTKDNTAANVAGYCIVLASRITKTNAAAFVERLHGQGYADARVLEEKPLKVVCGAYASEAQALKALAKMREKAEFKDCWIFYAK